MEIRRYQKSNETLIAKLPFSRLVSTPLEKKRGSDFFYFRYVRFQQSLFMGLLDNLVDYVGNLRRYKLFRKLLKHILFIYLKTRTYPYFLESNADYYFLGIYVLFMRSALLSCNAICILPD